MKLPSFASSRSPLCAVPVKVERYACCGALYSSWFRVRKKNLFGGAKNTSQARPSHRSYFSTGSLIFDWRSASLVSFPRLALLRNTETDGERGCRCLPLTRAAPTHLPVSHFPLSCYSWHTRISLCRKSRPLPLANNVNLEHPVRRRSWRETRTPGNGRGGMEERGREEPWDMEFPPLPLCVLNNRRAC